MTRADALKGDMMDTCSKAPDPVPKMVAAKQKRRDAEADLRRLRAAVRAYFYAEQEWAKNDDDAEALTAYVQAWQELEALAKDGAA